MSTALAPLLTTEEVATTLGIAPRTLVLWRHEGRSEIPFVKVGRAVRYRPADIQSYIDQQIRTQSLEACPWLLS